MDESEFRAFNLVELVVCETVAAITTHLRKITAEHPINYSGFSRRPKTLCDKDAAWDTKLPLNSTRCRVCLAVARGDATT
jgi:hypothetical protein